MTARTWCPSAILDETAPISVDDPSDAIHVDDAGHCFIADDEGTQYLDVLVPSDIVEWSYSEPRGRATVTVAEDGSYTAEGFEDGEISCWWVPGDGDTVSDTLDELVRNNLDPGEHEVEAYYWSEPIPHRFEFENGKGVFIRCDGAN